MIFMNNIYNQTVINTRYKTPLTSQGKMIQVIVDMFWFLQVIES